MNYVFRHYPKSPNSKIPKLIDFANNVVFNVEVTNLGNNC